MRYLSSNERKPIISQAANYLNKGLNLSSIIQITLVRNCHNSHRNTPPNIIFPLSLLRPAQKLSKQFIYFKVETIFYCVPICHELARQIASSHQNCVPFHPSNLGNDVKSDFFVGQTLKWWLPAILENIENNFCEKVFLTSGKLALCFG